MLQLQLLGHFQLRYNGETITSLRQVRLQSLLAYLVLHRHAPQPRQHLAFIFWPDSTEEQALTNLRKQLLYLRRALPDADRLIHLDGRDVHWQPNMDLELDVERFDLALSRAAHFHDGAIADLQEAIDYYRGELLPGCYDEWLLPKREELHTKYLQALEQLSLLLEEQRNYTAASAVARQLLNHDSLHEPAYLRLMRLYALNGNHAAAIQTYHVCVARLQQELGVEPSHEIQAAFERLLNHEVPVPPQRPTATLLTTPPFVGRRLEWQYLQTAWRDVVRGHAHLLVISGEAGIGKTRLAEELLDWANAQAIITARARAYAAEGALAYGPVIEWLRTPALKGHVIHLDAIWLTELARLMPELLTEQLQRTLFPPAAESWQRHRFFEALARAILSVQQPLLLLIDDIQWCDQETLAWLHFFLRYAPQAPVLILATARAEEVGMDHPLATLLLGLRKSPQLTEITLKSLDAHDTAQLAQQMVGQTLDATLAANLYRSTEGHPLFVVETVRAHSQELRAAQWSVAPPTTSAVLVEMAAMPVGIQVVLETRLAQLSPLARKQADLAAVIGRDFTFDVLMRASDSPEDELVQGLEELWQRQIVRERGGDAYDFSHDMLREVIYAKVSTARRRVLHRRIAQTLEIAHVSSLDEASSQIAVHFERGGLPERAIPAYARAARAALRVHAYVDAIGLFERGLALIATLPVDSDRSQQELNLLLGLGPALAVAYGFGFVQVQEVYLRAQELTQVLGYPPNASILLALALFYVARRNYDRAYSLGQQLCALSTAKEEPDASIIYVEGHYILGVVAFWFGNFVKSREHLQQALGRYTVERHALHTALYIQDTGVVCLVRLAFTLWYLGYPEQAQQRCAEAIDLARRLGHPFSLAYALSFAAWVHNDCRNSAATHSLITELLSHCEKHGIQYWLPLGYVLQGDLLAKQGEVDRGIAQIRAGILAYQSSGHYIFRPYALAMLAQAYAQANALDQGIAALDEAFVSVEQHGDYWYAAELHRLKGELLAQLGATAAAVESCYQQALTMARQQQARSLEVRAATSLARLWQQTGRAVRARRLLGQVYDWFSEGLQTPDLQAAAALLKELS